MQRVFIGVAVVIAALVTGIAAVAEFDAQKQSAPPHPAPPVAEVAIGPLPPAVSGADPEATQGLVVADYLQKERERAEWIAAEERRLADEAERQRLAAEAEAARAAALRPVAPRTAQVATPTVGGNCDQFPAWFPHYIIWRESNCTRGINTGNGYYGAYQVAGFHWNGGICSGLTWTVPAQEDECADRLSAHGTNLRPWGF